MLGEVPLPCLFFSIFSVGDNSQWKEVSPLGEFFFLTPFLKGALSRDTVEGWIARKCLAYHIKKALTKIPKTEC